MTTMIPIELGHTCMNHFAILDYREVISPSDESLFDLSEIICATSVADDLLVLQTSDAADVRLRIFGGNRREGDFCGNGMLYVAAKVGTELQKDTITIESAIGIKTATNMGNEWKVEVGPATKMDQSLLVARQDFPKNIFSYGLLKAGEPHLVIFHPIELEGFHVTRHDFENYCRPLCDMTDIPGGINVSMVFQIKFKSVLIRTFERGARRHTFSCGTGSVSAVVAVFGTPEQDDHFHVCAPGGSHDVIYENSRWYLAASPQRIGVGYLEGGTIHLPLEGLLPYKTNQGEATKYGNPNTSE